MRHNETDGRVGIQAPNVGFAWHDLPTRQLIRPDHPTVLCPRGLPPNTYPVDRFCGLWSISYAAG